MYTHTDIHVYTHTPFMIVPVAAAWTDLAIITLSKVRKTNVRYHL